MKVTDIAHSVGKSKTHIYRTLNDESYNKHDLGKIMILLNFEEETLKNMFLDDTFIEMCEIAVAKGRNNKVKEFASHCKALHLYLKGNNAL